jgi:hypothetical protein
VRRINRREYEVKVFCDKGVAIHINPKPCVGTLAGTETHDSGDLENGPKAGGFPSQAAVEQRVRQLRSAVPMNYATQG